MLYLEDYLEMIEHLPQELRDRFTEMREMDLSVQNVIDSLEKRVRMLFSQCRRNELQQAQADNEFTNLRRDYYKVLEDADEKVHLASQMYDLVERYLRRLDSELHKFKCELEADHNGITEILEKRSLELDGNSTSMLNNLISGAVGGAVTNNSQKENRYFGSVSTMSGGNSNSHGSVRDRDRYRHKAEKRRDSNNGPSSLGGGGGVGPPPEKRQMMSTSMGGMNHNSISGGGGNSSLGLGSSSLQANNFSSINPMATIRSGGQNMNLSVHYGGSGHSHHGSMSHSSSSSSSSSLGTNLNLHSSSLSHSAGANPVIVTTTLGTGANAVSLGSTSYTAESEVMRAASQAITMTHQMQQGRRTASLKASVEAATSGGVAGGSGQDLLGRELVGATHNAIQAVERESFNSNQRRHKKKITSMSSMGPSMGSSSSTTTLQLTGLETSSAVTGVRMDDNGMIIESTADGEWTYDPNEPRYCICNQVSYGDMVACDNDVCPFEWFHYPCVGITQSPKGKWYCPQCTSSMKRRGSRKT